MEGSGGGQGQGGGGKVRSPLQPSGPGPLEYTDDGRRGAFRRFCDFAADFYLESAGSKDDAVREAACHAIAELATKVEHKAVGPFAPQLLSALIACLVSEAVAVSRVRPPPLRSTPRHG
jgi:hypothetical protein